jgi:hypothetical protein
VLFNAFKRFSKGCSATERAALFSDTGRANGSTPASLAVQIKQTISARHSAPREGRERAQECKEPWHRSVSRRRQTRNGPPACEVASRAAPRPPRTGLHSPIGSLRH